MMWHVLSVSLLADGWLGGEGVDVRKAATVEGEGKIRKRRPDPLGDEESVEGSGQMEE